MSVCPNCGCKLRLRNVSQYCPECGVNMRFCGFEENFYREAKQAELSFASLHIKLRHFKAAFLGSKLTKARLFVMLLPIVSLLVPAGSIVLNLPFKMQSFDINIIGFVGLFTGGTFSYVMGMTGDSLLGGAFSLFRNVIFLEAAVAVAAVLVFLLSILCFISIKNMQKITSAVSVLGIALCIADFVSVLMLHSANGKNGLDVITGNISFGLGITVLAFVAVLVVNLLLVKKGIPVKYEEGDLERAEIARKVKSGELNLDNLSQPVVETAATRAIDVEIEKEEEAFREKYGSESTDNGENSEAEAKV